MGQACKPGQAARPPGSRLRRPLKFEALLVSSYETGQQFSSVICKQDQNLIDPGLQGCCEG